MVVIPSFLYGRERLIICESLYFVLPSVSVSDFQSVYLHICLAAVFVTISLAEHRTVYNKVFVAWIA